MPNSLRTNREVYSDITSMINILTYKYTVFLTIFWGFLYLFSAIIIEHTVRPQTFILSYLYYEMFSYFNPF